MMVVTLNIEKLKKISPNIFFSEWKRGKSARVRLFNILKPKIEIVKETTYYLFDGEFLEKNYLEVEPLIVCVFWISKQCFETEIIRHIDFCNIDEDTVYISISFNFVRNSQRRLIMKNFSIN